MTLSHMPADLFFPCETTWASGAFPGAQSRRQTATSGTVGTAQPSPRGG
jgi:hypothetical protein